MANNDSLRPHRRTRIADGPGLGVRRALHAGLMLALLAGASAGCRTTANSKAQPDPAPVPASSSTAAEAEDEEEPLPPLPPLPEEPEAGAQVGDPLEGWNRWMFQVNDKLYFWVLRPVAQGYRYIAPQPVRKGVRNFFQNLATPVRLGNALLQLKFKRAGAELARFGINTTVGVLGFGNPAKNKWNITKHPEDLGQTLGYYKVEPGFYIVWPGLGPSTVRDSVGNVGDWFLHPLTWITVGFWPNAGIRTVDVVNTTTFRIGDYEDLKKGSLDPYIALRNAYHQHREHLIADEKEATPKEVHP